MQNNKLRYDFILLLAAVIWGFAFVAQRVGMDYIGPFTYTAVRFTLGTIVLIPLLLFRKHEPFKGAPLSLSGRVRIIALQLLLGMILFGGISFQQYGLQFTTAGNAGFITGLYVVFVPVVALFFGQKNKVTIWLGMALTIVGLYFLSVGENFTINRGDYFVAVCALFWTVHVLVVGYLAPKTDPIRTAFIQFLICSVLSWIVALGWESVQSEAILHAWIPVLYGGIMSVGIAYTLQIVAQQHAHPAYASIILSLEALFAVIGGWLLLSEPMTLRILLGCALMLLGMIVVQVHSSDGEVAR